MGIQGADVVVVGAGFGGLQAIKNLRGNDRRVLLIDRHNYHTFQPLLYQVATAGLGPEHVAHSIRDIFQEQNNVDFLKNSVVGVDFEKKKVLLGDQQTIDYRYLVLAVGASANFFGIDGAEEHAIPMKNLSNAIHLRSRILDQFETAHQNPNLIEDGLLNFVLVGGGPTGVETAGALAELFDHVLRYDYSEDLVRCARVVLVEMLPHLLNPYEKSLREYTIKTLQDRGVEVMTETTVEKVSGRAVHFENRPSIRTRTLIWAAGVKANPLANNLNVKQTQAGRIAVEPDLTLQNRPNVFAVGDLAGATDESGDLLPQLAPVAIQQGRHAAQQIKIKEQSNRTHPFDYDNPGQMATIGRHAAVVELENGVKITGYVAWVIWVGLHIAKLIGFRNKFMVFLSWAYNYFTYGSSSRLILDVDPETDEIDVPNESAFVKQSK